MTPLLSHAAPLHYLPSILKARALYAKSILAPTGVSPRATAARRDRMLGLADYVHLSLTSHTPLLADKLARGYPHALLVFPAAPILSLPHTALLPYNTKAWATRAAYAPITDPDEQARLLRDHDAGRYPSLEVLAKYGLDLALLSQIAFITDDERELVTGLADALSLPCPAPCVTDITLFPLRAPYLPTTQDAIAAYFAACRSAGTVLPPPAIPFD